MELMNKINYGISHLLGNDTIQQKDIETKDKDVEIKDMQTHEDIQRKVVVCMEQLFDVIVKLRPHEVLNIF